MLQTTKIIGSPRKLRVSWNPDLADEFRVVDSLDVPDSLEKDMIEKRVGYWRGIHRKSYRGDFMIANFLECPDVNDFIDLAWNEEERKKVSSYLKKGRIKYSWMGCSECRICRKWDNGSHCLTDGEWIWPEGFAHYIEKHNVKPPQEFVDYVLQKYLK